MTAIVSRARRRTQQVHRPPVSMTTPRTTWGTRIFSTTNLCFGTVDRQIYCPCSKQTNKQASENIHADALPVSLWSKILVQKMQFYYSLDEFLGSLIRVCPSVKSVVWLLCMLFQRWSAQPQRISEPSSVPLHHCTGGFHAHEALRVLLCFQAAAVCLWTWALAVSQLPTLLEALDLDDDEACLRVQWNAPVLLGFSPKVTPLSVLGNSLRAPGLAAFFRAARQLKFLRLVCRNTVDAAYADYLLGGCTTSSIKEMDVAGKACPSVYPPSLEQLWANQWSGLQLQAKWGNVLVLHLARLQHLRKLDIRASSVLQLGCRVQLPHLEEMRIGFNLCESSSVHLDWLTHQPCKRLKIRVDFDRAPLQMSKDIVSQLNRIQVHRIMLNSHQPLEVQEAWQELQGPSLQSRTLSFYGLDAVGCEDLMLQLLPSWGELLVTSGGATSCCLAWALLVRRHGQVNVNKYGLRQVHIMGCDGSLPTHSLPLQLVTHSPIFFGSGKQSVPASQACSMVPGAQDSSQATRWSGTTLQTSGRN